MRQQGKRYGPVPRSRSRQIEAINSLSVCCDTGCYRKNHNVFKQLNLKMNSCWTKENEDFDAMPKKVDELKRSVSKIIGDVISHKGRQKKERASSVHLTNSEEN